MATTASTDGGAVMAAVKQALLDRLAQARQYQLDGESVTANTPEDIVKLANALARIEANCRRKRRGPFANISVARWGTPVI